MTWTEVAKGLAAPGSQRHLGSMTLPQTLITGSRLLEPILTVTVGIMAFAAIHHGMVGLRRPRIRVHLTFAALCALGAWWTAWAVVHYTTRDPDVYLAATRARESLGLVMGVLFLWFLAFHTGFRPRIFLWAMTAVQLALVAVNELLPFGLLFSGPPELEFLALPWGETVTTTSGPLSSLWMLSSAIPIIAVGFGFWASLLVWREGRVGEAVPILVALAVLVGGMFNLYRPLLGPMPSGEVAFLGLIIVMSLAASHRVVEAGVMQELLADSEQRLRTLVENAPEAVMLLDGESGVALEANDVALRMMRIDRSGLSQLNPALLSPPHQDEGEPSLVVFERRLNEAQQGGRPVFRWIVRSEEGEEVPCEARLVRLPGPDPGMVRLSLVDLKTMEEAESRQLELESQLRQSQRLEALGRLTGGIAHDFNNLLAVIQGNLGLLLEEDSPGEDARQFATEALHATERSAELTHRLVAFARRQPLEPTSVHFRESALDLTRLLKRTLGEDVRIEFSVPDHLWTFEADPVQLESGLLNLAVNARDAMPRGGTLTIRAENMGGQGASPPFPEAPPGSEWVSISVSDTGTGMDVETRSQAIDPFFTTKTPGKGSGLGLSMVYGFVNQSGGTLHIDSEVGEGTTVTMLFPRCVDGDPAVGDGA